MTPHWSAEDRCTKPASALRHARRVRCLTHHTLMTPEPRELAGRAARSSSSTCAHHHTRAPTDPLAGFRLLRGPTLLLLDEVTAAQCFGPPRCSARRPVATRVCGSQLRGRAETSKRVPPVRPVSYGYATDTTLGRLRYSNQPSSPRRKSIAYTSPNPITYH